MSHIALWLASGFATAFLMELWAALLHGRVWHGALWFIHRSHHQNESGKRGAKSQGLEANDSLSFLHAPVAIALILYGCVGPVGMVRELAFGVGLGMTAFGFAYIIVHDGLAHERLPVQFLGRLRYFARVRAAHMVHHRAGGEAPYGLFLGPWVLRRRKLRQMTASQ